MRFSVCTPARDLEGSGCGRGSSQEIFPHLHPIFNGYGPACPWVIRWSYFPSWTLLDKKWKNSHCCREAWDFFSIPAERIQNYRFVLSWTAHGKNFIQISSPKASVSEGDLLLCGGAFVSIFDTSTINREKQKITFYSNFPRISNYSLDHFSCTEVIPRISDCLIQSLAGQGPFEWDINRKSVLVKSVLFNAMLIHSLNPPHHQQ